MNDVRISAVIITRNEQANITAAIESLKFADQIVVADTLSDDSTVEIARRAGAEVFEIPFEGYGAAKNKALEFCRGDWIFSLDADERVTPELAQNLMNAVKNDNGIGAYAVNRLTYFLGRPVRHSGWFPDYVVRFFKRGHRFSEKQVHESLENATNAGKLPGLLLHYSYTDLDQYIEKLNSYTTLNAREMFGAGRKSNLLDMIIHSAATFFKMYVFKAGFLDGSTGFVLAILSSYHVFIKYAKLRQLTKGKAN